MADKKCECCGRKFTLKHPSQRFCSHKGKGNCKDRFHNSTDPVRRMRAIEFTTKPSNRPDPTEEVDGDLYGLGEYDPGDDEYWGDKD